ncbi:MAG: hypothetical protein KF796_19625 [Ramlibacter sp.]|nr:hypothetical protein [Ramlibacter sp.]
MAWPHAQQPDQGCDVSISAKALQILERAWREAPELAREEMRAATTTATLLYEREVKEAMPRGATGLTAASITSDVFSQPAGVLGVVGSTQPSAAFVELGTRPHMPPVAALVPWVREVLGVDASRARSVAFLVARKIATKGTPAQRPFEKTLQRLEGQIVRMFEDAADRLAQRLPGGAS